MLDCSQAVRYIQGHQLLPPEFSYQCLYFQSIFQSSISAYQFASVIKLEVVVFLPLFSCSKLEVVVFLYFSLEVVSTNHDHRPVWAHH